MPNINAPNGFWPTMRNDGGGETKFVNFDKAAGLGTAIFRGDLVTRLTDNTISPVITPGTTPMQGVALTGGAASTLTRHRVAASVDAVLEAQMNGAFAMADLGLNANAVIGAGDALTGMSGHQVNSTGIATTATLDLKLDQFLTSPTNEVGSFARVLVRINRHQRLSGTAGI
jgi:hypothetical protein